MTIKLDLDKIDGKNVETRKKATKDILSMNKGLQDRSDDSISDISRDQKSHSAMTVKIGLQDVINKVKQWLPVDGARTGIDAENELSENGLLAGYYNKIIKDKPIDMQSLIETVFILRRKKPPHLRLLPRLRLTKLHLAAGHGRLNLLPLNRSTPLYTLNQPPKRLPGS